MILADLLSGLTARISGSLEIPVKGVAYDSRKVGKGYLFVAIQGFSMDGHDYIEEALSRGAIAIVTEYGRGNKACGAEVIVEVSDSRIALALIASEYYGRPSESLSLVGITGTNGKTTTSFITKSILEAGGMQTGLLGTVKYITGKKSSESVMTTPESLELQGYLRDMVDAGMDYAVLEVSSHALSLKRVEGCNFKVGAFVNLSQDHLDFHGSMEEYYQAKKKLFSYISDDGYAVINQDDPAGERLCSELGNRMITCGTDAGCMLRAMNVEEQFNNKGKGRGVPSGMSFDICTPESAFRVSTGLIGRFNVQNILVAAGIARSQGLGADVITEGIRNALPVEGRFERVDEGQAFLCVVDFAHTDDALLKLLTEIRHITAGKVITVFGCGGDRDRSKRPLMGAVAAGLSDHIFITSDNPRSEDPVMIINEVITGISRDNYTAVSDREEAIRAAVALAKEGDTLVVAGKGHEEYQIVQGVKHHFSDREVLVRAIREIV